MALHPAPVVLVVEDHPDTREMMLEVISREGYPVRGAASGAEALEQVQRSPPRVVVLDIGLPDMDGLEVARRLRTLPGADALAIVAVSGHFGAANTDAVLSSGADAFLPKPVDLEALEAVMARLLTSR
jgi:CheY-like chemotaxis protein